MSSEALGQYLRELITERGITISGLSKQASLSRESIYRLLRGEIKEPELSTLVRLSNALRVHPILLLRKLFNGWEFAPTAQPGGSNTKDAIGFVDDVSYPDNSIVSIASEFTKTWEIQNLGKHAWKKRKLVCIDDEFTFEGTGKLAQTPSKQRGLLPLQKAIDIPETKPGANVQISVTFRTPEYPCTAVSFWKMAEQTGELSFPNHEPLSCMVKVVTF